MLPAILLTGLALPQEPETLPSNLDLQISPAVEMWFEVRTRAQENGPVPEGLLQSAILQARALDSILSGEGAWVPIDGRALQVEPGGWVEAGVILTKGMIGEGQRRKPVRTAIDLFLAEMDSAAEEWMVSVWPERKKRLEEIRTELTQSFHIEVQAEIQVRLELWTYLPSLKRPAPMFLTTKFLDPGQRTFDVQQVTRSILRTEGRTHSQLCEAVINEWIHHTTRSPATSPPLTLTLIRKMQAGGVRSVVNRDRWMRLVVSILAAELTRLIDPEHKDYLGPGGHFAIPSGYEEIRPRVMQYVNGELAPVDLAQYVTMAAHEHRWEDE